MAPQVTQEEIVGEAQILQLFPTKEKHAGEKVIVAGCRVESGSIKMAEQFRVIRDEEVVWSGSCKSMKRLKLEVRQVGKVQLQDPFLLLAVIFVFVYQQYSSNKRSNHLEAVCL